MITVDEKEVLGEGVPRQISEEIEKYK